MSLDLKRARAELLAAKSEIESRLERTHRHIYEKDEPVSANFNEQIKQTENDSLVMALEQEGQGELLQIEHAIKRLDAGEYLLCEGCGEEI